MILIRKVLITVWVMQLCLVSHAQTTSDAWNYVGIMYPHPDSMRGMAVGFGVGSSGYIGTGLIPNSTNCYQDFYRIRYDAAFQLYVWTPVANFPFPTYGATGFGAGGKGYVLTAHQNFSGTITDQKLYSYDTLANTWSAGVQFPGTPRAYMTSFVVNGKAYVCTGSGISGAMNEVWEYDPAGDIWTQKNNFPGAPRFMACSFAIGSKGYLGTGTDGTTHFNDLWEYDPLTDNWTQKASMPGPGRFAAAGVSAGTRGYITMGSAGVVNSDTWEYDPGADAWVMKQQFPGVARSHAVSFTASGHGYVGTGIGDSHNTFWAFVPGQLSIGNLSSFAYCQNDSLYVPYNTNGLTFQGGNSFIAEMDYGLLAFTNPIMIGAITGTASYGTIPCHIPANAPTGVSNAKIRVRSTNAAYTGGMNALNLSINAVPAQPSVTQNGNLLTCSPAPGYQWYDANGPIAGATNQTYLVTTSGVYYVKVISDGCSSVASASITITVNAIAGLSKSTMSLFPNPAGSVLNVSMEEIMPGSKKVRIFNHNGQIVMHRTFQALSGKSLQIPVSFLGKGIYMLELTDDRRHMHQLFVKE